MTEREIVIREAVAAHPAAAWYLRLPLIRHLRAIRTTIKINRHYAIWTAVGSLPVNADLDYAIRDAIWRGEK